VTRERSAGAQTNGAKAGFVGPLLVHLSGERLAKAGCVRQKRVVLASVADVKLAEVLRARPGAQDRQSADDGDNEEFVAEEITP